MASARSTQGRLPWTPAQNGKCHKWSGVSIRGSVHDRRAVAPSVVALDALGTRPFSRNHGQTNPINDRHATRRSVTHYLPVPTPTVYINKKHFVSIKAARHPEFTENTHKNKVLSIEKKSWRSKVVQSCSQVGKRTQTDRTMRREAQAHNHGRHTST